MKTKRRTGWGTCPGRLWASGRAGIGAEAQGSGVLGGSPGPGDEPGSPLLSGVVRAVFSFRASGLGALPATVPQGLAQRVRASSGMTGIWIQFPLAIS